MKNKKLFKKILIIVLAIIVLAGAIIGGIYYYKQRVLLNKTNPQANSIEKTNTAPEKQKIFPQGDHNLIFIDENNSTTTINVGDTIEIISPNDGATPIYDKGILQMVSADLSGTSNINHALEAQKNGTTTFSKGNFSVNIIVKGSNPVSTDNNQTNTNDKLSNTQEGWVRKNIENKLSLIMPVTAELTLDNTQYRINDKELGIIDLNLLTAPYQFDLIRSDTAKDHGDYNSYQYLKSQNGIDLYYTTTSTSGDNTPNFCVVVSEKISLSMLGICDNKLEPGAFFRTTVDSIIFY
ncbi:MAG TPA: hypothetical protein P5096_00750 [Patescibacteria group bacterium]|nr:hypothetical protein [Patescibacteria group bacterium]